MDILFYALLAVFLAWRLYSILGTRHEGERQRPNPFEQQKENRAGSNTEADKKEDLFALPLPREKTAPRGEDVGEPQTPPLYAEPAPLSLAGGLHAIYKADPSFDEKNFIKGARMAFEMIVKAFASGDRTTLKNLLSNGLYTAFARELDAREQRGERHEIKTLILRDAELVAARLEGKDAVISVQFASDQARIIFDKDGGVLVDPGRAVEQLSDTWIFRRTLSSQDPNWKLVDTRAS